MSQQVEEVGRPEATLTDVSIKSFNRSFATFVCELDISNPYIVDLPITDISYTLKSAGREVAAGVMPDPGWIKARTETKVEVTVKVPYDFLISVMKDVGRDWDVDYELDVGLIIDLPVVGDITIPLKRSGELKLPTLPSMISMVLSSPNVWFMLAVPITAFLIFLLSSRGKART